MRKPGTVADYLKALKAMIDAAPMDIVIIFGDEKRNRFSLTSNCDDDRAAELIQYATTFAAADIPKWESS